MCKPAPVPHKCRPSPLSRSSHFFTATFFPCLPDARPHRYSLGYWAGWARGGADSGDAAGKFVAQHYARGQLCDGNVNRAVMLFLHCNHSATVPSIVSAEEVKMCSYELHMQLRDWCALVDKGIGGEMLAGEEEGVEEGEEEGEEGEEVPPSA